MSLKKRAANACKIILPLILIVFLFISCASLPRQKHSLTIEYGEGGANPIQIQDLMDGEYEEGVRIGLCDAESISGYYFTNWTSSNGGAFVNDGSETYFIMPGKDTVITAHFALSGK